MKRAFLDRYPAIPRDVIQDPPLYSGAFFTHVYSNPFSALVFRYFTDSVVVVNINTLWLRKISLPSGLSADVCFVLIHYNKKSFLFSLVILLFFVYFVNFFSVVLDF